MDGVTGIIIMVSVQFSICCTIYIIKEIIYGIKHLVKFMFYNGDIEIITKNEKDV